MKKVLIICGPTATGKTKFALEVAKKFNGELVSADSRQVYIGKDIVTGKDLPPGAAPRPSHIKWRDRHLPYYEINHIKLWLYDVVRPGESFGVGPWKECADLVLADIISRNRLPIVVGGSGLYLKSLIQNLSRIRISPNLNLRRQLSGKSQKYLFNYLNKLDSLAAARLNVSDRSNPRRLIRAIEIALSQPAFSSPPSPTYNFLQIGLTATRPELYRRVDSRVAARLAAGVAGEDPSLAADPQKWRHLEHAIIRHQLTWFKTQPEIFWFDITHPRWQTEAAEQIRNWYNLKTH